MDLDKAAGKRLADLLGVPAAYITSGAGSALTLGTAAFMAGIDDKKIQQLPDTSGMPNEIIIQKRQRYWYDRCLELAGAKLVEVGNEKGTTHRDLVTAITETTAAVAYPVAEQNPVDPNILSLEEVIDISHKQNKPVMVDAAGQIYPLENFGKYVKMGADFQCIAAKYMGAPHSTGLALGTEEIIDAISRHSFIGYESRRIRGIGRPHKIDRLEIIGVVVAVKRWLSMNHEERLSKAETQTNTIFNKIRNIDGINVKIINNIIGHQPFGLAFDIDESKLGIDNESFVELLKNNEPSIRTRVPEGEKSIVIHVFGMNPNEAEIVGDSIAKIIKEI